MNVAPNITVYRKKKVFTRVELEALTKEELIDRILQLEAHNNQLKNVIKKTQDQSAKSRIHSNQREFQFDNVFKRHVLLKLYYLGWDYQGFATQEDSIKTVEHHLFNALIKTCLIKSRETSNYHRCGRTDKGVSAFSQVISIDVRSKFDADSQNKTDNLANEINYCEILNRVLPIDIRCIAWKVTPDISYSARFDCTERMYRYFFPKGNLDIEAMQVACTYLEGTHDFRHLCKMDVANGVVTFIRDIDSARIRLISKCEHSLDYDMYAFEITSQGFLWHQIRCIMAIMFLIGQKNESPSIIEELFNIEKNPCTPQYSLAIDTPLNLYRCEFRDPLPSEDSPISKWIYDNENLQRVLAILQGQCTIQCVKTTMIKTMLDDLIKIYSDLPETNKLYSHNDILMEGVKARKYQTLMSRPKCKSLENRIVHFSKKRRIDVLPKDEF